MSIRQLKRLGIRLGRWFGARSNGVHDRNAIAGEQTVDILDNTQRVQGRSQLATRILERDFAEIRRIEAALTRIDDGAYGFIADAIVRLNGITYASFRMLHCASIARRRSAMYGAQNVIGDSVAR